MSENTSLKKTVTSVCPYCGVGCGLVISSDNGQVTKVSGNKEHPSNKGRLCTKGQTSTQVLTSAGRMSSAFVRTERQHEPVKTPMAQAIQHTASQLKQVLTEHGAEALSFYVSGQMSLEAQYLINKLAKGYIGTNNIESNSRLCMASAGAGYKLSLGSDAPPGSYDDFDRADLFLVLGANMADCHPILYLRMMDRVKAGAKLIVVDPRRSATAEKADLHLAIKPSTDLALLNGLLHLLVQQQQIDPDFIAAYTEGWEALPEFLADYNPANVSQITGLSEADIGTAAQWLAQAGEFMSCWTMGINQSSQSTWNTNAICNLHLATGKICREGSGPFSLTGQPNAMGGREMGYMGPGLPGQRTVLVDEERAHVERLWQLPAGSISTKLGKGAIDMFERMQAGEIKACWIICTNPVATVPNRQTVIAGLEKAQVVIAQDAFLDTETNRYADILLPAALWAEAEGVMVNSERNLTLMQQAVEPLGEALPDWHIICEVAKAMGYKQGFSFDSAEQVFAEITQFYNPKTGYDLRGASYARLRESSLQWPCPPQGEVRNPIRYRLIASSEPRLKFATPSGKAQFFARPYLPAKEMPDADYPLIFNTGRLQHQWHTLTKTGTVATLNKLNPSPFVEIHPQDAKELALSSKDQVEIRSRRGRAILPVQVSERVQPGQCFAPFHWNDRYGEDLCVNAVTSDRVDPISMQPELKMTAVALTKVAMPVAESSVNSESFNQGSVIDQCIAALGVKMHNPPVWTALENQYLSGFMTGLQLSAARLTSLPIVPTDAPLPTEKRDWLNGLLAGMFSRTELPAGAAAADEPAVPILWASQTGNAEALAEQLAQQLKAQGRKVVLCAMNDYPLAALAQQPQALFITSTFGDGEAPDNGADFWQQLSSDDAPKLASLEFALLALGDANYAQFCGHGKRLQERLQALGATPLLPSQECDTDFDDSASGWFGQLIARLPKLGSNTEAAVPDAVPALSAAGAPATPVAPGLHKNTPYAACLVINQRLNAEKSEKDVRLFGLELGSEPLPYEAGDALGIWPQNAPEWVFELEQLLKFNAEELVLVDAQEKPLHLALQHNYEICRPSLEIMQLLAQQHPNSELKQLVTPSHRQELQAWLYGRQLADVLAQYPLQCSSAEFLQRLKRIQPRLYSIASSPKLSPQRIDLTVAVVRYERFNQGRFNRRAGVSSSYLADRAQAGTVPIFLQSNPQFRLPERSDAMVIMIGPGTGIAPFRAFLQERQARGDTGKNWLFFGEQHQASDFYYQEELQQYQNSGLLTHLSLAFSRDQASKIYVQQRMQEQAAQLWEWLEQEAYIYVCGDASRMAKDVDQALRDIVQRYGQLDDSGVANYMRKLSTEKRYRRDVY